jgi:hypothetical protein
MYVRHRQKEDEERAFRLQHEAVVIRNLVEELFTELRQYCTRERSKIEKRVEKNRELMEAKRSTEIEKRTHKAEMEDSQKALAKLDRWEADMQRDIALCTTVNDHNSIKTKLWETTRHV